MATTTGLRHFDEAADATSRARLFAKSRRHTLTVVTLRRLLPVACLAMLGLYSWYLMRSSALLAGLPQLNMPVITAKDLTMHNPHYEGYNKDGGTYSIRAVTARQEFSQAGLIKLETISGEMIDANKSKTTLAAVRGDYDNTNSILDLFEKIDIDTDTGMKARLTQARILTKDNIVTSKKPVHIEFPAGSIDANEMFMRQKVKEVAFINAVRARLNPPPVEPNADAAAKPATAQKLFARSDQPVNITSTRLDIDDNVKRAVFAGSVRAVQAEATLSTPEMTVFYDGDAAPTAAATSANQPGSGKLKRIVAKGPVAMTRGPLERVTSNDADFDAEKETAILTGNVIMTSGPDRRAMSERVELDQKADTALLTGDVLVVQGLNQLKGRRLFVNRTTGRTELTSPDGPNAGRISARMMQKPARPGEASEPAAEPAGFAAQGFKSKPGAPLDVEAGRLDVNDTQKVAVFTGKVVAKQDTFTLTAEVLEAYYTGSAALADPAGPQTASGDAPPTELSRVKATTNVVMVSTDGRKVTGDWAEFDTKANKAIVGGDVVLTQGKSRVLGTRLTIDMTTGQSTIDTAPANTVAAPAGGGWVTDAAGGQPTQTNSGRPSATFFPNEFKKKGQKPAATSQPAGAADQGNTGPDQPAGGN